MTDIKRDERNHLPDGPEPEADSASTLLPMLISGLVLIVVSMIVVAIVA
jgi:hypothetical protein